MKRFVVILTVVLFALSSLALVGCGKKEEPAPAPIQVKKVEPAPTPAPTPEVVKPVEIEKPAGMAKKDVKPAKKAGGLKKKDK